jgi:purine-binding chemotaxis protein CheW
MAEPSDAPRAAPIAPAPGDAWLFCVRAGGGRYAFDAALVSEVVRLGTLTRLPGAPSFLPGVFTHRGDVLAVLDLCQALSLPAAALGASARAAVLRVGEWRLALLADAVEGLAAVPARTLEAPPAGSGPATPWLTAVGRDRRGPIAVLDVARLVAAARDRSLGP